MASRSSSIIQGTLDAVSDQAEQDRELRASLTAALDAMVGKPCWGIVSGRGAVIGLHIGAKLRRETPATSPYLTADLRENDGEFGLMVSCAWRLDGPDEVVCGSGDPAEPMSAGLDRIADRAVTAVRLVPPALDLIVAFGDLTLTVFCDGTDAGADRDNYLVFAPTGAHGVGARGAVSFEGD
jgi:hypothetical protein